ncbi:MAG: BPSS1780 family membrane protein [Methylotenera sp.]|nr:BPSS1780 family membrane protein [Methylotenera sp.]
MAILDSNIQTGRSWMKESVALFKATPGKWMLLAAVYVAVFMMMPSLPGFQFFSLFTILIWPIFMVIAIAMYRNADNNVTQSLSEIIDGIKPKIKSLMVLGGLVLLYGVLISLLLNSDIEGLTGMAKGMEEMTDAQAVALISDILPFLLKLTLALIPMMMATWFSPMLIAFNNYTVAKALKSSIAGSLQYLLAMGVTWILLTLGIFALLLIAGIFTALLGGLSPALGQMLMPTLVFGCLLLATALMLAFQYVSYRDVFRAA